MVGGSIEGKADDGNEWRRHGVKGARRGEVVVAVRPWDRWTRFVSEEIEPGTKNRLRRCSAPRQPAIIPLENLATRNFPPTVGCHLRSAVKHEPARSRWNPWKDGEPHDSFKNRAPAEIHGWDTWLARVIYATGTAGSRI